MVIDTGFNFDDPHVLPSEVRSFCHDGSTGSLDRHGNMVARVIASQDPCCLGVAPLCDLFVAKAWSHVQRWDGILGPLDWAAELDVDVVNMSFVFTEVNDEVRSKLDALNRAGVIIVSSFNNYKAFPHSYPSVVSVGGEPSMGVDIALSPTADPPIPMNDGRPFTGTSVSSAKAAGVAACAKSYDRNIDRNQFLSVLRPSTAGSVGFPTQGTWHPTRPSHD
jgi:hypothetical protein